jgi:hypothetical protein
LRILSNPRLFVNGFKKIPIIQALSRFPKIKIQL